MAIAERLKIAELSAEASFIRKKIDAELQSQSLMVEEELAKAQARAKILEEESKEESNKAPKPLQRNFGSSSFIKEELNKSRSSDGNACSKSQAIGKNDVHFKIEKTEYPTWSSADCPKDYESMNGIWTPELNIPSPNQNHLTRVPTDSYHPIKKEENITDMMCRLLKEQAAPQVLDFSGPATGTSRQVPVLCLWFFPSD